MVTFLYLQKMDYLTSLETIWPRRYKLPNDIR